MKTERLVFTQEKQWECLEDNLLDSADVNIVFVFGSLHIVEIYDHYSLLQVLYPHAEILICSTAGNILDTSIDNYSAVATALSLERSHLRTYATAIDFTNPYNTIQPLLESIDQEGLKHLLFFAPGIINGSEILDSMTFNKAVSISGGFAGDNFNFDHTYLQLNTLSGNNIVIIVALYGESLHVALSSESGWQEFGSQRLITKSKKNIIYEIDHKPAIELYKRYLGEKANNLPNSALRFPLCTRNDKQRIIRTILQVNEDNSLFFSGDMHEGSSVKLMKTNVHNILDSAFIAAKKIRPFNTKHSFTLVVSCCARRSVLKQFSEEELEIIQDILTTQTQLIGFYSYGEVVWYGKNQKTLPLNNQTITLTTIFEN